MEKLKLFDLYSARDALVIIKPLVEDIIEKREELWDLTADYHTEEDELEKLYIQSKIAEIEDIISANLDKIQELGGVIKGTNPILVDFLARYKNRNIWLCWKEDEDDIYYWHEINEGFAGRKPIEEIEEEIRGF